MVSVLCHSKRILVLSMIICEMNKEYLTFQNSIHEKNLSLYTTFYNPGFVLAFNLKEALLAARPHRHWFSRLLLLGISPTHTTAPGLPVESLNRSLLSAPGTNEKVERRGEMP